MGPTLPEVAGAPGVTHVGQSKRLHKPLTGALGLCCPGVCKEVGEKRLLNHEKNKFSV